MRADVSPGYLQGDIGPGETASPAEADLHVVKPTVSLGDVPDLRMATALRHRLAWRRHREEDEKSEIKEWRSTFSSWRGREGGGGGAREHSDIAVLPYNM